MKKILFAIVVLTLGIMLYTCSSPTAVDFTTEQPLFNSGTPFYSEPVFDGTYLGVSIDSGTPSISIGFYANSATGGTANYTVIGTAESIINNPPETNYISGSSSSINFQNGVIGGTINVLSANQIQISFHMNESPFLRMTEVTCKKRN